MKRVIPSVLAVACLTLSMASSAALAQEAVVTGLWKQVDPDTGRTGAWFLFSERGGVFEGAVAKTFPQPGEEPNRRCTQCEGAQKNAPVLGLVIIKGMRRQGLEYENGTIMDPRNGSVYNAVMHLSPDGRTLVVRGYLGIALFGKDQTWYRLPDSNYAQLDPSVKAMHPMPGHPAGAPRSAPRSAAGAAAGR
jgi:uncharacterized protein (DUF2147 family)